MMWSHFGDIYILMKPSVTRLIARAGVIRGAFRGRKERHKPGRAGVGVGLAAAGLVALLPFAAEGRQTFGMVRYDHPVFHNGHRVLFHGAWRGRGGSVGKPAASEHEFTVLADTEDSSASRMAGDLVTALRAAGLKARALAGKGSPTAVGRYIQGDSADLAITPLDALMSDKTDAQWRERAPFIIRLGDEPIEIIAKREIAEVGQLTDRRVSLGSADAAAGATAEALFQRLGVKPKGVHEDLTSSLGELAGGKLDAVVVVGAADSKAVADFGKDGRFHLVSVPWSPALRGFYAPARLTAKDSPRLIGANDELDTVATPMALIAIDAKPGSTRAAQDSAVVSALFEKFDSLLAPYTQANWREVNLAASADWPRLAAASEWIESHRADADSSLESFRATAHSVASTREGPDPADADRLYRSLMEWRGAGP